jgi:hypothetical protein
VPSAEEKVAAALAAGHIDLATSLVYRVYAAFGSASLPEEFRSLVVDPHAATFAFADVAANESRLSPEQVAAIAPYRARPSDPVSIFSQPQPVAAVGGAVTGLVSWVDEAAAGGKARVWVPAGEGSAGRLAERIAAVNAVWPVVFGLIPEPIPDTPGVPLTSVNPDGAIDIYFADAGTVDQRVFRCRNNPAAEGCTTLAAEGGYTDVAKPFTGHSSSAYSVIDLAVSGGLLTSHIAHELAHTSQYQYDFTESAWLKDSTATWAAYRVLQKLELVPTPAYEYLPKLFAALDSPITRDDDDDNRYAAWLYVQSLAIRHGDAIAKTVFEKMAADGVQGSEAVDSAYPFAENFGDFALGNWNEHTADRYRDSDRTFPSDQPPLDLDVTLANGAVRSLGFETGPLSADYARLRFSDDVGLVMIESQLAALAAACACTPSVWLVELIGAEWKEPFLLTEDTYRYCRTRQGENIEELIVVVANPDTGGHAPLAADLMPTVTARAGSCEGGGTITISRDKSGTYTSARNNPVEVKMHDEARISFDLVADEASPDLYAATTATITWSYTLSATETGDECTIVERAEGSGSFTGTGGPSLTFGLESDGTLFGMTFNEDAYTLTIVPPSLEMEEGDPRSFYRVWSDVCGFVGIDARWLYTTLAIASGKIPADRRTLSGSVQRTLPSIGLDGLPTSETITWSIDL